MSPDLVFAHTGPARLVKGLGVLISNGSTHWQDFLFALSDRMIISWGENGTRQRGLQFNVGSEPRREGGLVYLIFA